VDWFAYEAPADINAVCCAYVPMMLGDIEAATSLGGKRSDIAFILQAKRGAFTLRMVERASLDHGDSVGPEFIKAVEVARDSSDDRIPVVFGFESPKQIAWALWWLDNGAPVLPTN